MENPIYPVLERSASPTKYIPVKIAGKRGCGWMAVPRKWDFKLGTGRNTGMRWMPSFSPGLAAAAGIKTSQVLALRELNPDVRHVPGSGKTGKAAR